MAFPLFLLAMAIVSALGNNTANVIYATAVVNLPFYIRMSRAEAARLRGAGFIEAARTGGRADGHGPAGRSMSTPTCCRRWPSRSRSTSAGRS